MKERIKMVVFVVVLGSVWTSALVVVDTYTKPIIEKHQKKKVRRSILGALGIDFKGKDIDQVFIESVDVISKEEKTVYRTKTGDVAFSINGPGSQGPIAGILALDADLQTIEGITIVHHVETPGLGERVLNKETLSRFKGKKVVPSIVIVTSKTAGKNNEVQGVTGATLTCKAFQALINSSSKEYISLFSEDK